MSRRKRRKRPRRGRLRRRRSTRHSRRALARNLRLPQQQPPPALHARSRNASVKWKRDLVRAQHVVGQRRDHQRQGLRQWTRRRNGGARQHWRPQFERYTIVRPLRRQHHPGKQRKLHAGAFSRRRRSPAPTTASPLPDGTYTGALHLDSLVMRFSVQFKNGVGTGTVTRTGCGSASVSLRVGLSGDVTGDGRLFPPTCASLPIPITGRVDGGRLLLGVVTSLGGGGDRRREFVLAQGGGEATDTTLSTGLAQSDIAAASPPATRSGPASAAVRSPDGLWRGTYTCGAPLGIGRTVAFTLTSNCGSRRIWRLAKAPALEPTARRLEFAFRSWNFRHL